MNDGDRIKQLAKGEIKQPQFVTTKQLDKGLEDSLTIAQLIVKIEELTLKLQNPKGGSCQNGARNYFLATINDMRELIHLPRIKKFEVYGVKDKT